MGLFDFVTGTIGVADALSGGLATVELNITGCSSIKELYEKLKDVEWKIGEPFVDKGAGVGDVIAWPAFDKNNQVQIWYYRKKFVICRSTHIAGNKNFMASMALDSLTDGLSSLSGSLGGKKDICNQMVKEMGEQINGMNL